MRIFKGLTQSDLEESHAFFQSLRKWLADYSNFSDDNEGLIAAIEDMRKQASSSEDELWGEIIERRDDSVDE